MSKWTEERTAQLRNAVTEGEVVSREAVAQIAEDMGVTSRSISAKLRKEGFEVEKAGAAPSNFTEEETEALRAIVEENSGELTYAQIAERLGTDHSPRSVQGKILSMELTAHVAPTPPKEVERTYTDEEAATVADMANNGNFLEEIAQAVGKSVNSVRGKALSLLKSGEITALPKQRDRKPAATDVFNDLGADAIANMTVEDLVEATGKTARGVKTVLTRRQLRASDYDGVAKSEKAAANS